MKDLDKKKYRLKDNSKRQLRENLKQMLRDNLVHKPKGKMQIHQKNTRSAQAKRKSDKDPYQKIVVRASLNLLLNLLLISHHLNHHLSHSNTKAVKCNASISMKILLKSWEKYQKRYLNLNSFGVKWTARIRHIHHISIHLKNP